MSSVTTQLPSVPPTVHGPVTPGFRPGSGLGVASGPALTPQDVIRILKRHVFLIVGIFMIIMTLTVIGTFIWGKFYPSYTAVAMVEVRSPQPPPALGGEAPMVSKDIMEQTMNTQAAVIKSQGILQKALEDPIIKQTSWYRTFLTGGKGSVDVNGALISMNKRLTAAPVRDTYFIQVSFSWRNAAECASITNVVLDAYYASVESASKDKTRNEFNQFQKRAEDYRNDLQRKMEEQERHRTSSNIPLIEQRRNAIGDQVAALTQLLAQTMTEKDQAQALYEMYNRPGALEQIAKTPEMNQTVENETSVRMYTQMLGDLRIALESAKEKGPSNRTVKELEVRIRTVERELNEKKRQVISDTYRDMKERTRVQLDTVNTQVMGLLNRLAEAKQDLSDLEKQLAKYITTKQEIESLTKKLEAVEQETFKLKLQLESPDLVRVSIPVRAVTPLERSSPRWIVNIPAGFMLGLMLGVGVAFLLEFMSTTVRTPADVVRQLSMQLLGQIPSQSDEDEDEITPFVMQRMLTESPHSILAESFRQLRANLLFSAPAEQLRSILVTSCAPSEGKTCVAVDLAISLASAGRRVLLVDANFRRPGVAQAFGLNGAGDGLSSILVGHPSPESLIQQTAHANLDVLSAGPLPSNPAELLSGRALRDLISRLNARYETVIFDGPPVLVVSDAMVMATSLNGVILIVRAGVSARGAIQRARDQLKRANAKVLGVILNDVKATRGGYFREMYKTYYEYQSSASLPNSEDSEDTEDKDAKAEKTEPQAEHGADAKAEESKPDNT